MNWPMNLLNNWVNDNYSHISSPLFWLQAYTLGWFMVYLLFKSQFQEHHLSSISSNLYLDQESTCWSLAFRIISSLGQPHSDCYIFKVKDADGLFKSIFHLHLFYHHNYLAQWESCSMLGESSFFVKLCPLNIVAYITVYLYFTCQKAIQFQENQWKCICIAHR